MTNILVTKKQFKVLVKEQAKINNTQLKKMVTESVKKLIRENDEKPELISFLKQAVENEGGSIGVDIEISDMKIFYLTSDGFSYETEDPMKYHEALEGADLQRALYAFINKHKDPEKYINDIQNILHREKPERLGNYDEEQFMSYDEADIDILQEIVGYIKAEKEFEDSKISKHDEMFNNLRYDEDEDEEYYKYLDSQ